MTDLENELIDKTKEYLRRVDSGDIAIPDTLTYDAYGIYLDGQKNRFEQNANARITPSDINLLFELCVTGKEGPEKHKEVCLAAVDNSSLDKEDKDKLNSLLRADERVIGIRDASVKQRFTKSLYEYDEKGRPQTDEEDLRNLVKSLIDVHFSNGDDCYSRALEFPGINTEKKIDGLEILTISKLLHCSSPNWFPLVEWAKGESYAIFMPAFDNYFLSDVPKWITIEKYIDYAKKVRNFLDDNYPSIKNMRTLYCASEDEELSPLLNKIKQIYDGKDQDTDISNEEDEAAVLSKQVPPPSLNTILYGPPGTGKTYSTVKYAVKICDLLYYEENKGEYDQLFDRYNELVDEKRIVFTTFHQSFGYEDFIEGIRPVLDSEDGVLRYKRHDGIFKTLCDEAKKNENENDNFVIIIDEINRGNVARIFGELITLLEDSKRLGREEERQAILPYSAGESFGVPQNVYVLGTMNTADRSLTQLDTALRRRFDFVEVAPDSSLLKGKGNDFGIELDSLLEEMNERIERLYDREHKIGHSYFLKVESFDDLKTAFEKRIIPLLQEYFYDDYDKIRQVLSDKFVSDKGDGKSYELVSSTEWVPEHFVEIYNPSNSDESAEAE